MAYQAGDTITAALYNVFVASSSSPFGYNHFAGTGSGEYGLGQSELPQVTAEAGTVTAAQFNTLMTGIDNIAKVAQRLGLGEKLNLGLPGERDGLIPTKKWKLKTLRAHWLGSESLINAIGQGYVLSTPLQLAVMTSRVVNGGYAVTPRLTRHNEFEEGTPRKATDFPSLKMRY